MSDLFAWLTDWQVRSLSLEFAYYDGWHTHAREESHDSVSGLATMLWGCIDKLSLSPTGDDDSLSFCRLLIAAGSIFKFRIWPANINSYDIYRNKMYQRIGHTNFSFQWKSPLVIISACLACHIILKKASKALFQGSILTYCSQSI